MTLKSAMAGMLAAGLAYSGLAGAERYSQGYDQPYEESGNYGVATLEERVARLEKRQSGSAALVGMANEMEQLQAEVLKLRGQVEELAHALDKTRRQQRDMYGDLDQRLSRLTPPAPAAAAAPGGVAAAANGAAPAAPAAANGAVPPVNPAAPPPGGAMPVPAAAPVAAAPVAPPPPPAPVIDPAVRRAAYEKAFNTLDKEGKYNEAVQEFKTFLANYPAGEFTDKAYYWLGQANYVNRDFPAAGDSFRKVVGDFPQSGMVPDAKLMLGFIEYENGQYAAAREQLNGVIKSYPGSSAAKLAEKRLERMRAEKR